MKTFTTVYPAKKTHLIKQILRIGAIASLLATSPTLLANNGSLSIAQQGDISMSAPRNGQKKQRVESEYGAPLQKISAVGEPPISKWVYQDFTVYFEYNLVIHAVLSR